MEGIGTGSDLAPKMQAASHKRSPAQTCANNSGMLLLANINRAASMNCPSAVSRSSSPIGLFNGQASTQVGFGHWMQRLACSLAVASSNRLKTASKSPTRSPAARLAGSARLISDHAYFEFRVSGGEGSIA